MFKQDYKVRVVDLLIQYTKVISENMVTYDQYTRLE